VLSRGRTYYLTVRRSAVVLIVNRLRPFKMQILLSDELTGGSERNPWPVNYYPVNRLRVPRTVKNGASFEKPHEFLIRRPVNPVSYAPTRNRIQTYFPNDRINDCNNLTACAVRGRRGTVDNGRRRDGSRRKNRTNRTTRRTHGAESKHEEFIRPSNAVNDDPLRTERPLVVPIDRVRGTPGVEFPSALVLQLALHVLLSCRARSAAYRTNAASHNSQFARAVHEIDVRGSAAGRRLLITRVDRKPTGLPSEVVHVV